MTELATDSPIQETEYSGHSKLYRVGSRVGAILRRPLTVAEMSEHPQIIEHDRLFAQLLIELEDEYGVRSPNLGLFKSKDDEGRNIAYIEGQWVEGKNLFDDSAEVPPAIMRRGLKAIIDYYAAARHNGGYYLADLQPENIIFGRTANDKEDHLYFIDMEPLIDRVEPGQPLNRVHLDRILPQLWMLIGEGMRNGEDWEDLNRSLDEVEGFAEALPSHP